MLKREESGFDYFGFIVASLYAAIFSIAYFLPEFSREHLQLQGLTTENPVLPRYGPLPTTLILTGSFVTILKPHIPNIVLKATQIAFGVIAIYGVFFIGLVFGSAFAAFGVIVRLYCDNEKNMLLRSNET